MTNNQEVQKHDHRQNICSSTILKCIRNSLVVDIIKGEVFDCNLFSSLPLINFYAKTNSQNSPNYILIQVQLLESVHIVMLKLLHQNSQLEERPTKINSKTVI